MKSLLLLGLLVWYTEGLICIIGQERDPESGFRYRWVIPVPDPCQCTTLRVGGLITRSPYRPFVVTYKDTFIYSDDQEEIRTWLNCTGHSALIFKDCSDALTRGVTKSGVYLVKPSDSGEPFQVYCDMETDGGGWTVFQRRIDGSVDFFLDFASYRRGFGNLHGEFWLGNDNLHRLTAQSENELRVDLSDFGGNSTSHAVYALFSIANVSDNYRLTVGQYSGTAGDSLISNNGQAFTTKDRDNDGIDNQNCAVAQTGAWWYKGCSVSNLNGRYGAMVNSGVFWYYLKRSYDPVKYTEMKLRMRS